VIFRDVNRALKDTAKFNTSLRDELYADSFIYFCLQSGHSLTTTVLVIVLPQIPQPLSTPAVIVYLPGLTPLKPHITLAFLLTAL
jgi:hypothetical protein